jgi:uncharacterized protein (DUF697 family)
MSFSNQKADEDADKIINGMAVGTAGLAVIPPVIDVAVYAVAVGASVIAIGNCYGVKINDKEAARLVMEFLGFASFTFGAGKLISGFLKATGLAYAAGGIIDAVLYSAMSYAIGKTAQAKFKGERDPEKLKSMLNTYFKNPPKK